MERTLLRYSNSIIRQRDFDPLLEQYLALLITNDISVATRRAVRSDLTHFCTWWESKHQRAFDLT